MKLDLPDEYVPLIVTALEQYHAYTRAIQREDARYQEAADWFKRRRSATSEERQPTAKRKRLKSASCSGDHSGDADLGSAAEVLHLRI
jgi:hypothetical protein